MKQTRRLLAFLIALSVLFSMMLPVLAADTTDDDPFEIQNDEARRLYNSLVATSQIQRTNAELNAVQPLSTGNTSDETGLTGDFAVLSLAEGSDEDKSIIYNETDGTVQTVIEYNAATGTYSLMEAASDKEDVLYMVDGEGFVLVRDGENINMVSEAGEIRPLIIVEYLSPPPEALEVLTTAEQTARSFVQMDGAYSAQDTTTHNWSKAYGPYYKTNKQWCVVLSILSQTISAANYVLKHPTLDAISLTMDIIAAVGDSVLVTLYIRYYFYYDLNDMYWTKERHYCYSDSNYVNLVKVYDFISYDDTPW